MKRCARCENLKDDAEFNWRWHGRKVLQSVCRGCQRESSREHYEKHKENVKAKAAGSRKEAVERAERFIFEYLSSAICVDCGEYDFSVLTFDHVRGEKKKSISEMIQHGYSLTTIKEELEKTEVVCANCHMRREQRRRGKARFEKSWPIA